MTSAAELPDRRTNPWRRGRFDEVVRETEHRLDRVAGHMPSSERKELAVKMARVRLKYEYDSPGAGDR